MPKVQEAKNCAVAKEKDSAIAELLPKYFLFSCDNAGIGDTIIDSKWSIWIPSTLLNQQQYLQDFFKEVQNIEIKTNSVTIAEGETSNEFDIYKTTFESESFSTQTIQGRWGGSILMNDSDPIEPWIYKVTLLNSDLSSSSIYLQLSKTFI